MSKLKLKKIFNIIFVHLAFLRLREYKYVVSFFFKIFKPNIYQIIVRINDKYLDLYDVSPLALLGDFYFFFFYFCLVWSLFLYFLK